jgi:phenylacetic acid degradation operon negative regulatory protein
VRSPVLGRFRPQPQFLIGDLFANYWSQQQEPIPSAALVALLGDFGITVSGSRTALSRLARAGRVERTTLGRRTYYRQTAYGAERIRIVHAQLVAFGPKPRPWDGEWRLVAFHITEAERGKRPALRSHLRSLGFGPLFDGLWISPHADDNEVAQALREVGVSRATVFRARITFGDDPARAWDLAALAGRYRDFIGHFEPYLRAARERSLSPAEALVVRTAAHYWRRRFAADDPDLPAQFLPKPWPRADAHRVFAMLDAELEPLARRHVEETVMAVRDGTPG